MSDCHDQTDSLFYIRSKRIHSEIYLGHVSCLSILSLEKCRYSHVFHAAPGILLYNISVVSNESFLNESGNTELE